MSYAQALEEISIVITDIECRLTSFDDGMLKVQEIINQWRRDNGIV